MKSTPFLDAEENIFVIFFGDGRSRKRRLGHVDAFIVFEKAALNDAARSISGNPLLHLHAEQSIIQQDRIPGTDVLDEIPISGGNDELSVF